VRSLQSLAISQTQGLCPLAKYSLFSPSGLSKHPRMGSAQKPRHLMRTRMELWGFIKSSTENKAIHMEVSHHLSFQLRRNLGGYRGGGYRRGIPCQECGVFSPMISPPNPVVAPTTTYEYLFCLSSSGRLRPPARRKAHGLLSGSSTSGSTGG
jgi:hypothetical protein